MSFVPICWKFVCGLTLICHYLVTSVRSWSSRLPSYMNKSVQLKVVLHTNVGQFGTIDLELPNKLLCNHLLRNSIPSLLHFFLGSAVFLTLYIKHAALLGFSEKWWVSVSGMSDKLWLNVNELHHAKTGLKISYYYSVMSVTLLNLREISSSRQNSCAWNHLLRTCEYFIVGVIP